MKSRILTTFVALSFLLLQIVAASNEKTNIVADLESLANNPSLIWTCAHRANTYEGLGGAVIDRVPENSIAAILKAIEKGADIVEIDVRKTIDNQYVLMHDGTVNRTTNKTGVIAELSLVQIKNMYLKTDDGVLTTHRVPTLIEALEAGSGKVYFNLDIARLPIDDIIAIVGIVADKGMLDKTLFYTSSDKDKANAVLATNNKAIVFPWVNSTNDINFWHSFSARIKTVQTNHENAPELILYARTKGMVAFSNTLDIVGDIQMLNDEFQKIESTRSLGLQIYQTDYTDKLKNYLANNAQQVTIQWAANIGPANNVQTASPSLNAANDVVYFANGANGKLHAFNTSNGSTLWEFDYTMTGASNAGRGSAVVGEDGTIYFPATQASSPTNYARLFSVNPNGTLKWEYQIGIGANISYISPAITKDGDILLGNNGTDGALHLVNRIDGTRKAYVKPAGGIIGALVVSQNNIVYGITGNYGLVAYDLNNIDAGTLAPASKGTYKVQNENNHYASGASAIDGNGNVIAAFNQVGGDDAAIVALNATSENISSTSYVWQYLFTPSPKTSSKIEQYGASIGADGTIYVAGHETQKIYAFNPDGSIKWIYDVEESVANSSPAIDNRGYLHFGGWNGNYYIVKDNITNGELIYKGKLSYAGEISSQIWSSLAIANDGSVYISAQVTEGDVTSSRLYKVSVDGTTGPANSYWPMKGGSAQRTGLQIKDLPSASSTKETNSNKGIEVFSNNNTLTAKTSSKGEIIIYDLFGRVVVKRFVDTGVHSFELSTSQMYIVKWENVCTKVLVR